MKLFTKDINQKLFAQYRIGSDLNKQKVVAKIFNPYGRGRWYLLNSDPNDPDYLWAIVQMGDEVEIGSVSRNELESIRIKPHGLPLERDMYFSERNAMEVLEGLEKGKTFASGGMVPGRWYKDNSGNELRFIGESDGQLLFKDGDKLVKKSEVDFDGGKEEFKLFKWFKDGGETKDNYIQKLKDLLKLYVKYRNNNKSENEDTTWRWLNIPSSVDLEDYGNLQFGSIEPLREDGIEVILHRYTSNYQNKIDKHFQYNFSTENKEKKEGTFGYHTYIYAPLTNDIAKSFYNALIKDNKYLSRDLKNKMADGGIIEIGSEGMYRGGAAKVLKYDDKNKMYAIKYLNEDGEIDGDFVMARKDDFEYGFSDFDPKMADGGELTDFKKEAILKKKGNIIIFKELLQPTDEGRKSIAVQGFVKSRKTGAVKIEGSAYDTQWFSSMQDLINAVDWSKWEKDKMAMGGKVTFNEKVKAIQKKLLANKKVPKAVQKDYGKTFTKGEAKESAQRIVGAMVKKGMK